MNYRANGCRVPQLLLALALFCPNLRAQIDQKQIDAFHSVRNVKIVVTQSPSGDESHFRDTAEACFTALGYSLATNEDNTYDATYTVEATGTAIGATYGDRGYLLTGARVKETIRFEVLGYPSLLWQFEHEIDPPFGIIVPKNLPPPSASDRSRGRVGDAFASLQWTIPYTLGEVYGVQALIKMFRTLQGSANRKNSAALSSLSTAVGELGYNAVPSLIEILRQEKDVQLRVVAAEALGHTKDSSVVGPLIDALGDSLLNDKRNGLAYSQQTEATARALQEVTGEAFGSNEGGSSKWREWWRENKEAILLRERNVSDPDVPRLSFDLEGARAFRNCLEGAVVKMRRRGGAGAGFRLKSQKGVDARLKPVLRDEYSIIFEPTGRCIPNSWVFSIAYSRRDGTEVEQHYQATFNRKSAGLRIIEKK
jgi:hypothetical protein